MKIIKNHRTIAAHARRLMGWALPGAALAICGCEKKKEPPPPTPTVEVAEVKQRDVPIYREAVGSLAGDVDASIVAQVTGYLLSRDYTEGTAVTNGQVLFQIDPAPFRAELEKAKSDVTKAQAQQLRYALMVKRYIPLAASEAISKQELDDAVQNEKSAQAQVEAGKSAAEQAQLNLGFTTIRSPVDGIAGLASAKAQVGNLVGPNVGQLTTVTKVDPIRVYFSVDQRMIEQILARMEAEDRTPDKSEGPELELVLASGTVYPSKGKIRFRNNQLDVKTGTVKVVGEFPNTKKMLVPGMFVSVRALVNTDKHALLVPQRSLTEMQGKYLLAVVGDDNKISIRPVTTGERVGQDWVVTGEVKAGDRVVAEGVQKVREGLQVNPVPFTENLAATNAIQPTGRNP